MDGTMVRNELLDQGVAVIGAELGAVDLRGIESRLRNNPFVAEAEVYHTLDGVLHVEVRQRTPIARVYNRDGSSFYIDDEGWAMPTSPHYTARVMVFSGALDETGARDGVRSVLENDSVSATQRADEIHRLAAFIHHDPFWNALIDQVIVDEQGDFELLPRVGCQRVLIGDGSALEQRFAKLRIFYGKGMPQADWRRYERLDLRFADQIVCTKRTTP